jgi:selenide,water dikinase
LPPIDDPAVLVGTSTADDAAVYKLDDNRAIVQSVDLITPIVDDPYDYGQIAAANSLSDVYAMGGTPLFALAIVCFPARKIPLDVLGRILQGGIAKAREAGISILGGHSVEDDEPKYGLVVTGLISPDRVLTNVGARPGDVLVLTKPVGTGILTTALKRKQLDADAVRRVVEVMSTLNRSAAEALTGLHVHALTDVTGFGLLGHLTEMVAGSGVGARVQASSVPVFEEAPSLAQRGIFPGGTKRNLDYFGSSTEWLPGTSEVTRYVLADPQTSGGLLIAMAPEDVDELLRKIGSASVIGEITAGPPGVVQVGGSP